jgi:hypothetical protein
MTPEQRLKRIRLWLILFVIGLVISGVTAFPLAAEVRLLAGLPVPSFAAGWVRLVREAVERTDRDYPFLFYGTDWLAFAHIVIGLAFLGPYRDPVRNIWVVQWGMLCCAAVPLLAFIAGPIRGIPFWWQLIDTSFGVFGVIPLWIAYRQIKALAASKAVEGEDLRVRVGA